MLTYLSIQACHKKDKKFYGVWNIDFVNGYLGIYEGKNINDLEKRDMKAHKLEDFYLFVSFDVIKGVNKKQSQQSQITTLQMLNTKINKKKERR